MQAWWKTACGLFHPTAFSTLRKTGRKTKGKLALPFFISV
jgi:hypothetical protein